MQIRILTYCLSLGLLASQGVIAENFAGVDFPEGAISFADEVISYNPIAVSANEPLQATRHASETLGAPDYATHFPACDTQCDFVSLGNGGSITLFFDDNALVGNGTSTFDLWIFEIGPDVEDTTVEVGIGDHTTGPITWYDVGKIFGSTSGIDIDPWIDHYGLAPDVQFKYVRLTDDANEGDQIGGWIGADIDAIGAISTIPDAGVDCDVDVDIAVSSEVIPGQTGGGEDICGGGNHFPTSLTFKYTGGGCSVSNNSQDEKGWATCEGELTEFAPNVNFTAISGKKNCASQNRCDIYDVDPETPPPVEAGQEFIVTIKDDAYRNDFESKTKFELSDGISIETNIFNTSCSVSLSLGNVFGSLTLVAIDGDYGTTAETINTVYIYTVTNSGALMTDLLVNDSVFGDIFPVIASLNTGESASVTHETSELPVLTIVSASGDISGPITTTNPTGIYACTDSTAPVDKDDDGIEDSVDNCPSVANTDQSDTNPATPQGDRCDASVDSDLDGVLNTYDNCQYTPNSDQQDTSGNGEGDACAQPPGGGGEGGGCIYNPNAGNDAILMLLLSCTFVYGIFGWRSRRSSLAR